LGNPGLFSQKIVDIKYQQDSKGAYLFTAYNHAYCNYILEIHFTTFNNVKSDLPLPYRAEVKPGTNKLFSISPVNPNDPVQFNYTSSYNKGCIHPKADTNFTYLLPITPGKEAQAYELSPDKSVAGAVQQSNWYAIRLRMKPGDTIYAARRGVVTSVDDNDAGNDAGLASAGSENYVEIVQGDCSFGLYGILRKNSALVKPGQPVKAGEPIGLVGGDKYGRGSDVRFSVYYYQEENVSQNGENIWKMYMVFVPLQIWTKNNGKSKLKNGAMYISEYPLSVVDQESPKSPAKIKKGKIKK
jgi:hypothetical protein